MKNKIFVILTFCFITVFSYSLEIKDNMVIDNHNNSISLKEYNKIVLIDPAAIEIFYMLGAENKIAAIGKTFMSKIYPVEKTGKLPNVGNIIKPSIEKILSHSPDLVILNTMSASIGDNLKELNIPFVISEINNINEIFKSIEIYGELSGKKEEAKKLYSESKNKIETIKENLRKEPLNLKGAILYLTLPMMGFNNNSLPGEILNILGVENIVSNLKGNKPIISQEMLLRENPDFLAGAMSIKSKDSIKYSNSAVLQTKAGKNNSFIIVDSSKILRGSPRIFEEIEHFYNELIEIKKRAEN